MCSCCKHAVHLEALFREIMQRHGGLVLVKTDGMRTPPPRIAVYTRINVVLCAGGSKLFTRDGEKTALHLLIQEHCPVQHKDRAGTAAAWLKIYKTLRDTQIPLKLQDKEGKTRDVVVDMGPSMEVRCGRTVCVSVLRLPFFYTQHFGFSSRTCPTIHPP